MKNRLVRVCELLKRELSIAISREISFPVSLVTVSAVDITPDLRQAHVYISAIATELQRIEILRILEEARIELQSIIARRVVLKNTPHLHFHFDPSIERGSRVLAILGELGMDIAPDPSAPAGPPPKAL
ncbi:MAG: 30S ribosome-binding factor RbfA [Chthoniobacterales bacterium]|nr:30S ribosome-binding factor RbfA [Chthoniobacterales bacterium]